MAFESRAGRLDWKRDDDEPAIEKKPVLLLQRKFMVSMISLNWCWISFLLGLSDCGFRHSYSVQEYQWHKND
jgi:hypothetical protein